MLSASACAHRSTRVTTAWPVAGAALGAESRAVICQDKPGVLSPGTGCAIADILFRRVDGRRRPPARA
jgi:hypothetical protein